MSQILPPELCTRLIKTLLDVTDQGEQVSFRLLLVGLPTSLIRNLEISGRGYNNVAGLVYTLNEPAWHRLADGTLSFSRVLREAMQRVHGYELERELQQLLEEVESIIQHRYEPGSITTVRSPATLNELQEELRVLSTTLIQLVGIKDQTQAFQKDLRFGGVGGLPITKRGVCVLDRIIEFTTDVKQILQHSGACPETSESEETADRVIAFAEVLRSELLSAASNYTEHATISIFVAGRIHRHTRDLTGSIESLDRCLQKIAIKDPFVPKP